MAHYIQYKGKKYPCILDEYYIYSLFDRITFSNILYQNGMISVYSLEDIDLIVDGEIVASYYMRVLVNKENNPILLIQLSEIRTMGNIEVRDLVLLINNFLKTGKI